VDRRRAAVFAKQMGKIKDAGSWVLRRGRGLTPGGLIRRFGRLGVRQWDVESLFMLLCNLLVGFAVVGILACVADRYGQELPPQSRRVFISMLGTFGFQAIALLLVRWFLSDHELGWSAAFGFSAPGRARALLAACIVTVLVFPVSLGLALSSRWLMEWRSLQPVAQQAVEMLRETALPEERFLLGLMAMVTAPVVEEVLYRGICYTALKSAGFPRLALWGTAAVFALTHFNVMTFVPLVFFAVALTVLYELTGNLLAPILSHSLFNAANFFSILWGVGQN
jgi:membrane protease YdiL (CAAX protease family)